MKEALEGLLDTEHRTVQKHFNVTPYEDTFIRSAAKKAGMTQSRFMVDRILHTPMYYIGDPDFFQKFFYELNKQGVNLNQLTAAANTLVLLQDMPDVSKERRRELIGQIENFVATLKDPYCKALAETRGLMMQLRRSRKLSASMAMLKTLARKFGGCKQIKDYLARNGRAVTFRSSSIELDGGDWDELMNETRQMFGKDKGRKYYHFVISPDPEDGWMPERSIRWHTIGCVSATVDTSG